jgi:hypothetical protein
MKWSDPSPTVWPRALPGQAVKVHPGLMSSAETAQANKQLVRRLVDDVVNRRDPSLLDEVADGAMARRAAAWIDPFRGAFPDSLWRSWS